MKRLFLSVLTLVALFATLTLNAQNSSVNKPPAHRTTFPIPRSIQNPRRTASSGQKAWFARQDLAAAAMQT